MPISKYTLAVALALTATAADRVKTANGAVEAGPAHTGIRVFQGIPYAAPPVGDLRWKPPQPVKNWKSARPAAAFGPRCMQQPLFADMIFRSNGMGEDCLYLNVWTPAKSANAKLPVLVYFYGGGFVTGDGSESRYDGESMARKGIVTLTVNYRLGVFGFLAHPELTAESPQHASGNYGLLDQAAALAWVHANIARFGGDPARVTIAGESAGSISVSAQMASPLSKNLIAGAIGESGSLLGTLSAVPLAEAEKAGAGWATSIGAGSLAALRALSAQQVLDAAAKARSTRFNLTIDGYFFPESPLAIYTSGKQAHVPLLAGWNSEEMTGRALFAGQNPTTEAYEKVVRAQYGPAADEILKAYPATNPQQLMESATALAGDRFIAYSTWKWIDAHAASSSQPVYRYYYAHPRPAQTGAVHSADIEYFMGNLDGNKVYAWTAEDRKISQIMQDLLANFIKTANPNAAGLPEWPALNSAGPPHILHIDVETRAVPEPNRQRYLLLDRLAAQPAR